MKNRNLLFTLIASLFIVFTMSGCNLIGDIFKAGMWTGLIGLVLVIALVFWLFSRFRR